MKVLKMWESERNMNIDTLVKDFVNLIILILKLMWEKCRRKHILSFILGRNFMCGGPAHVAIEASLSFCVYHGIKKLHNEGTMQEIDTLCRVHC